FVASGALVPGEGVEGGPNLYLSEGGHLRFICLLQGASLENAAVSANGNVLLFATTAALLPSDSDEQSDVYRYDAGLNSFTQGSLGDGGAGNGPFGATVPSVGETFAGQSYDALTPDGERAFFTTAEALVPEDVNGEADVYEWANGTLGLISSG